LPDFAQYKATLIAISPQTPDYTRQTADEKELQFPVLSDVGNVVARQYGVAYAVGDAVYNTLKGVGINLETYNGNTSGELPLTGTFVIAPDGLVTWAQTDPNFKHRADPADILAALDELDGDD
ncbi:MAG: redoxin domain-containing protein, partial [Bacteroidetes bacterium]|nr:redoxin domain-containing protein [Fibrella sp.]